MKWVIEKSIVEIIWARSLEEGWRIFSENIDVDIVIMDASLGDNHDTPDSMSLVRKIITSGYKNPIIAASSNARYNVLLMEAGATHTIYGEGKIAAALLARKLL